METPIFSSPEKPPPASMHATESEDEAKKKKKKRKKKTKRIWNDDDELALLKGSAEYKVKTAEFDTDAFIKFVKGLIKSEFTEEEIFSKIGKLKKKYLANMERINQGKDPLFTRCTDSQAFGYSAMIWDQQNQTHIQEEDDQQLDHAGNEERHGNDNTVVNDDDDDDDDDELRDAFETMLWEGLSDYQKKFQLENLFNLGNGLRKELNDEWKALCDEEVKLNIKKLRLSAEIAQAACNLV